MISKYEARSVCGTVFTRHLRPPPSHTYDTGTGQVSLASTELTVQWARDRQNPSRARESVLEVPKDRGRAGAWRGWEGRAGVGGWGPACTRRRRAGVGESSRIRAAQMVTARDKVPRLRGRLCHHEARGPGRGGSRQARRGAGVFLISQVTGSP